MEIPSLSHSGIPNGAKLSPYFFGRTVCNIAVPVILPVEGICPAEEAVPLDLNFIEAILDYHINYGHQGSNDRYDVYNGRNAHFNKGVYQYQKDRDNEDNCSDSLNPLNFTANGEVAHIIGFIVMADHFRSFYSLQEILNRIRIRTGNEEPNNLPIGGLVIAISHFLSAGFSAGADPSFADFAVTVVSAVARIGLVEEAISADQHFEKQGSVQSKRKGKCRKYHNNPPDNDCTVVGCMKPKRKCAKTNKHNERQDKACFPAGYFVFPLFFIQFNSSVEVQSVGKKPGQSYTPKI